MSANRMFIVCQHCPQPENALLLADREDGKAQYLTTNQKRADAWYAKHQRCGTGVDHYKLAYQRTPDHDLQKPVASGVSAALLTSGGDNGKS